jgi:MFS family permease
MPEGIGAALILPAIVALVASIFGREQRPRAYGLVASAGAIAVAAGPLIGGLFTTYLSWRWVFAGEVVVVLVILALTRRMADTPPEAGVALDLMGTALSALGLGLIVYGILRSGTWGFVRRKPGAPEWLGLSPVVWLILAGGLVVGIFVRWENHRLEQGRAALIDSAILENLTLRGGLTSFFFQYLLQPGLFFADEYVASSSKGLGEELGEEGVAEFERHVRKMYDQMARICIDPRWARLYDFGAGRLPSFLAELAKSTGQEA